MAKILIDNCNYAIGSLPKGGRVQLDKLRSVDADIERLASQMAMLNAARASYTEALTAAKRSAPAKNDE